MAPLARCGGVFVEREVGSGAVIVLEILAQDAPQVLFSEDDDVVDVAALGRPENLRLHPVNDAERGGNHDATT